MHNRFLELGMEIKADVVNSHILTWKHILAICQFSKRLGLNISNALTKGASPVMG